MKHILNFDNFLLESKSIYKLTEEQKSNLLKLDEKYHKLIEKFRTKYVAVPVENLREEFDKFMMAKNNGQTYYPQLEIKDSEVDETLLNNFNELRKDFVDIKNNCYVAKFYIEKIDSMINSLERRKDIEGGEYETPEENPIDKDLYQQALDVLKSNPYKKPDYKKERVIDAEDCKEDIEDAVDDLDYDFDVELKTGMLPRMNVKMGRVNINKTSKFSKSDIEGLINHEIKGHVGRRYYGMKTGLWLFAYGTESSSTYDEGLAVWNSLNLAELKKANVMFNIAMKTCVSYLAYEMDFGELFDWVKKQAPEMSDYTAFKIIVRPRRRNKDCSIRGGESMCTYFRGYNLVKDMDDQMRDDILKYNIGPAQIFELENIKEFLKINHFKQLKTN